MHLQARALSTGLHTEVLLGDVNPALTQRVHSGFGADTLEFCAGAAIHLLCDLLEVDAAGKVHRSRVDTEDIGAGLNTILIFFCLSLVSEGHEVEEDGGMDGGLTLAGGTQSFYRCGRDGGERDRECRDGWWP